MRLTKKKRLSAYDQRGHSMIMKGRKENWKNSLSSCATVCNPPQLTWLIAYKPHLVSPDCNSDSDPCLLPPSLVPQALSIHTRDQCQDLCRLASHLALPPLQPTRSRVPEDQNFFGVNIDPNETVDDLKNVIAEKKPNRFRSIDADQLRFALPTSLIPTRRWRHSLLAMRFGGSTKISKLLADKGEPLDEYIDIAIKKPSK